MVPGSTIAVRISFSSFNEAVKMFHMFAGKYTFRFYDMNTKDIKFSNLLEAGKAMYGWKHTLESITGFNESVNSF